jgi:hypothetical protein
MRPLIILVGAYALTPPVIDPAHWGTRLVLRLLSLGLFVWALFDFYRVLGRTLT